MLSAGESIVTPALFVSRPLKALKRKGHFYENQV
nr:MAG TPA: hypothetical protein [Caudoviricetes sp.]